MATLTIEADERTLAAGAADLVTSRIEACLRESRSINVCLTGGSTPRLLYSHLATEPWCSRIDWSRIHFYWTDERHVPPDDPDSNFGMAFERLLQHVPATASHLHRVLGELDNVDEAARRYDETLANAMSGSGWLFDVTIVGVGNDAHIASLFPGSQLMAGAAVESSVAGRGPRAASSAAPTGRARITLTPGAVLKSRCLLVLVSGASKADAVRAALEGPPDEQRWPAQLLRRAGERVEWLIDTPAAGKLTGAR